MKINFVFLLFLFALFSLNAEENQHDDEDIFFADDDGITIVGSRNTTQQMEIVGREAIEKTQAQDIPSLLEESLGVGVTRYGPYGNQADVNIRGFNTKRVAVLIDGIPVNSAASGDFDFNSVDLSSIERIEVIYGGSDTKYNVSGALGGVINIVTVKKQKTGWAWGGSISNTSYLPGRYNRQYGGIGDPQWQDLADAQNINLFGAYGSEKNSLRFDVFGNRVGNNFLYMDDYGYARRKEGNEIFDAGASVSFIRELQNLAKFIASGSFYWGDKNIPVSGCTSEYVKQNDLASRANAMLEMPRAFHDDFSMELSLGHHWKKLSYNQENAPSIHNEHSLSLINRWNWYSGTKLTLRFGGDYNFISLDSTNSGLHYGNRVGLYLTAEFLPVENLLLIASLKGIADGGGRQAAAEIVPVPKFGLSWSINDNFTVKNNYYRSFKFPDFNDLYWVQAGFMGNPNLKNEDGWGIDAGVDAVIRGNITVNSVLYGEWTDNSIHWNNSSGMWRPENHGTGAFWGWDNKLGYTVPVKKGVIEKIVFNFSWLFQLSWLLSGELSFRDNNRIPYMPMHALGASAELAWKTSKKELPGSFAVSGRFESIRYADTANITELPPYFLLNLIYNQKMNEYLGVFGKISNALNAHYVSFADYPMPGISFTAGLRLNFDIRTEKGE